MSASVEVSHLFRQYGEHVYALRGIKMYVEPGEFLTLLGPSGSGKSTILKLIAGFDRPTAGDILIAGRSIVGLPSYEREVGMVFQNYALFPHMDVFENVAFPLRVRKRSEEEVVHRVGRTLEITNLEGYKHRMPAELSGGQQQRVALARAIVFGPKILLMDEPLGALDRHLREQMQIEIKRIQRELNMTALFVTHDQDEAMALSDRIAVMCDGRLEQLATPMELYMRPRNRFIASFVGEANIAPCTIADGMIWLIDRPIMPAPLGMQDGKRSLMIRPEAVALSQDAVPGGLPGRLMDVTFLGEATRYRFDVQGFDFVAKQQNGSTSTPMQIGQRVYLSWKPDDAVLLLD